MSDQSTWHVVTVTVPFPAAGNALLVKQVIEVDTPLRPTEVSRSLTVSDSSLIIEFKAVTVRQARVALDHCLSDVQLVVQTMHKFGPNQSGASRAGGDDGEAMEIGLMGRWEGQQRQARIE